jgi:hypothetical protein
MSKKAKPEPSGRYEPEDEPDDDLRMFRAEVGILASSPEMAMNLLRIAKQAGYLDDLPEQLDGPEG